MGATSENIMGDYEKMDVQFRIYFDVTHLLIKST